MTTEIDAEGLATAAEAIDTLWSEGQDRGPAFANTEREYQEHCRSTARAAITVYLATTSTSEAEPVAWDLSDDDGVFATTHLAHVAEDHRSKGQYRVTPLYAEPLPTPASDDQVEAVRKALKDYDAAVEWHSYRLHDVNREAEQHRAAARLANTIRAALAKEGK